MKNLFAWFKKKKEIRVLSYNEKLLTDVVIHLESNVKRAMNVIGRDEPDLKLLQESLFEALEKSGIARMNLR